MDVLLIDDIVDTAGTIAKQQTCLWIMVQIRRAVASHAVMSDPASEGGSVDVEEIIFTDSIPYSQKSEKVKILTVAQCLPMQSCEFAIAIDQLLVRGLNTTFSTYSG